MQGRLFPGNGLFEKGVARHAGTKKLLLLEARLLRVRGSKRKVFCFFFCNCPDTPAR
jgi:hypothetical protein